MEDKYDQNGYSGSDFKRNAGQESKDDDRRNQDGDDGVNIKTNEKTEEYIRELLSEKVKLDQSKFPFCLKLLDQELTRAQSTGRLPAREQKYVDVHREKPAKVVVKVLVPSREYPKFNFVGKLLGPKGNTLKTLQEETMCKMAILGRGSMRDKKKEDELRNSLNPKFAHLTDDLHVEISAMGPPAEAHARMAYALAEVRKYLIPDPTDNMRQRELLERPVPGRPPMARQPPRMQAMPRMSAPQAMPRPGPPPKTKIFSILDKARTAMEDTYSYDDPYAMSEPPVVRAPRAPEVEYYSYERSQDRYYEDEPYYGEAREYKPSRDVGSRRPAVSSRPMARASPYSRPAK